MFGRLVDDHILYAKNGVEYGNWKDSTLENNTFL